MGQFGCKNVSPLNVNLNVINRWLIYMPLNDFNLECLSDKIRKFLFCAISVYHKTALKCIKMIPLCYTQNNNSFGGY